MNLLKTYFLYIKNPNEALRVILQERSLKQACAGYFAATLGWVLFFNIGDGLSVPVLIFKLAAVFAAELTAGYFIASLCGLFLDFSRIKVSPAELFCLVGSAGFIKGLLIAFALVSATVPDAKLGWFAPIALAFVFALQLGYLTRALKRICTIGTGKAIGAWLFGFLPICTVLFLSGIFFIWTVSLLF